MTTVSMSIHRALAECKLIEKKLEGLSFTFITYAKANQPIQGRSQADVAVMLQGNLQSVTALINNLTILRQAIMQSNAVTTVTINGFTFTVAEAIAYKNILPHMKNLLGQMRQQYTAACNKRDSENQTVQSNLDKYLQTVLGEKGTRKPEDVEAFTKQYFAQNTFNLVDPLNLSEHIQKYNDHIMAFENEVDYVLSESNARTNIQVTLA